MIKQSDGKLGAREVMALVMLTIGIKLTDMTSTLLYNVGKNATWMLPVISGAVLIPSFLLLLKLLKRYQDQNLIDITYHLLGKYAGFLIAITLFVISFAATILNARSNVDILSTMFFPETPLTAIFIMFVFTAYLIAKRGLMGIGRTAWVTLPYIKGALLVLLILIWAQLDWQFLHPLLGPGVVNLVKGGIVHSSIIGEILFVTMIFPYMKSYKKFKIGTLVGVLITIVELSAFFAIYVAMFDYPPIELLAYPFQQMTRMIQIARFVTNLEAVFLTFWVVASVIRYAIYLYITAILFASMLRIKEFEPLLLPLSCLTVLIGMLPENPTVTVLILRDNILINGSWPILFVLPILLWMVAKMRGELKT